MENLREGNPADPISAVDFKLPHAKMVPNNHPRRAIALLTSQSDPPQGTLPSPVLTDYTWDIRALDISPQQDFLAFCGQLEIYFVPILKKGVVFDKKYQAASISDGRTPCAIAVASNDRFYYLLKNDSAASTPKPLSLVRADMLDGSWVTYVEANVLDVSKESDYPELAVTSGVAINKVSGERESGDYDFVYITTGQKLIRYACKSKLFNPKNAVDTQHVVPLTGEVLIEGISKLNVGHFRSIRIGQPVQSSHSAASHRLIVTGQFYDSMMIVADYSNPSTPVFPSAPLYYPCITVLSCENTIQTPTIIGPNTTTDVAITGQGVANPSSSGGAVYDAHLITIDGKHSYAFSYDSSFVWRKQFIDLKELFNPNRGVNYIGSAIPGNSNYGNVVVRQKGN